MIDVVEHIFPTELPIQMILHDYRLHILCTDKGMLCGLPLIWRRMNTLCLDTTLGKLLGLKKSANSFEVLRCLRLGSW